MQAHNWQGTTKFFFLILEATSDIFKLQDDKFWYVKTYLEKLHPKIMAFENKKEKIASAPSKPLLKAQHFKIVWHMIKKTKQWWAKTFELVQNL